MEFNKDRQKYLHNILLDYGRVAVAFSGGVDSSLLLKCALDTLGAGNVLVLSGQSVLLKEAEKERVRNWLTENGNLQGVEFEQVELLPLSWKEFVQNPEERCYLCKLRIYKLFKEIMEKKKFSILLDGTNTDDLKTHRPGLRAIHELGVKTPFVKAGFDKQDVRTLSRQMGLSSWELPSSSCLATRIPYGLSVTENRIQNIVEWEQGILNFGFSDCRVRLDKDNENIVYLQFCEKDIQKVGNPDIRMALQRFFSKFGVHKVFMDLEGR